MKSRIYLFALVLWAFGLQAQNINIQGTVSEASSGLPLPGVSISVDGKATTASDLDGNYTLNNLSDGQVVQFTYVGFTTFSLTATRSGTFDIKMKEEVNTLEDVVVIGYGEKKRKDVTGAVSVISAKTIEDLSPFKTEQALQGTVAGVTVTQQSGAPGAGLDIRIRGVGTNGNAAPLAIIDGYQGDLSLLNPSDIESITVLKDAQAAIYGTIGANGVILITTKKGRKNTQTTFSVNTYTGFQETTRKLPLLNATEYALLLNESYANGGQPVPFPNVSNLGSGTDWQDQVFDVSPIRNTDFSFRGGSDKISYMFSASDFYQEGIVGSEKSDFKRNTARLQLDADLTSKLKFSTNVIYTFIDRDSFNENGLGSVLFNAVNADPTLSVFDTNGNFALIPSTPGYGIEVINPVQQLDNTFNDYKIKKLNGSFGLDYTVTSNLILTGRVGFNTSNSRGKNFNKQVNYGGKVFDITRSSVNQNAIEDNDYTFDFFGSYTFKVLDNHSFTTTLGSTIYKAYGSGLFATGFDVPNNSWEFADIALAIGTSPDGGRDVGSYAYDERRLSYFGRLEYNYKDKYLVSMVMRRDASTRFGSDNRVAVFPSITAGWKISEEKFFPQNKIVNFLKMRVSYGELGNDAIGSNLASGSLSGEATYVINGNLVNGRAIGVLPNPTVSWEEARKFDFGLDAEAFNSKLKLTADYFIDTRADLLIGGIPVSGITGIYAPGSGAPTVNAGSVRNSGIEFATSYNSSSDKNFKFNFGYNVAFIKNEVLEVANQTGFLETGSFGVGQPFISRMQAGQPLGAFFGYQTDGIFQNQAEVDAHPSQLALGAEAAPGDLRYKDINGDGVINLNDRTFLGDPIPDVTMGFNVGFNYKNFDFSANAYASIGHDMVRNYERALANMNRLDYVLDRWTGEGTSNTVPRVTTGASGNNVFSDYFVEDASFLRIQAIQLGYSLSPKVVEYLGFSKFRIYGAVNNIYTFTKYKGFDPAASSGAPVGGGIDNGFYPAPRTFMLGLNLNF
ncbi:SusC/RagA family TonB-linked outer membrane protein [Flavobacterium sp.]|uniref:SusC/RagA family TonB-linked outer membrane protein n=1 Tax=Flavobacterium sp. TaxID=239 RepID=UPI003B9D45E1